MDTLSTLDDAVVAAQAYISGLVGDHAERYHPGDNTEGVRIYECADGTQGYLLRPVTYNAPLDLCDKDLGRWVGFVDLFGDYSSHRGGYRPGAGRKPLGDEPMERRTVTLPHAVIATLEAWGDGNLSAGIRQMVRERDA